MASLNPLVVEDISSLTEMRHAFLLGVGSSREVVLARRGGMHLDVTVPTVGRFRAAGDAFLTTERIIFAASKPCTTQNGMLFKGFDIPLAILGGEKFEQPILFGANNLSGVVETNVAIAGPVEQAPPAGAYRGTPIINSNWRLSFRHGGFGTFLRAFYKALERRRARDPALAAVTFTGTDGQWASMQVAQVTEAIPLDSTDGTFIYTAAPVQASAPTMRATNL